MFRTSNGLDSKDFRFQMLKELRTSNGFELSEGFAPELMKPNT